MYKPIKTRNNLCVLQETFYIKIGCIKTWFLRLKLIFVHGRLFGTLDSSKRKCSHIKSSYCTRRRRSSLGSSAVVYKGTVYISGVFVFKIQFYSEMCFHFQNVKGFVRVFLSFHFSGVISSGLIIIIIIIFCYSPKHCFSLQRHSIFILDK